MRLSSVCVWSTLLTVAACAGEEFTPTPATGAGGSAGALSSGAGGSTETAGATAAGTGGVSAGAGGLGGGGPAGSGGVGGDVSGGGFGPGGANAGGSEGTAGAAGAGAGGAGAAGVAGGAGIAGGAGTGGNGGGGNAAGGAGGLAGGAGSPAGGAAGGSGAAGAAACVKAAPCGDGVLQPGEGCDIAGCADNWCTSACAQTAAAASLRASEICRGGICWMVVATKVGTRTDAALECGKLNGSDGRSWRLGYWLNDGELANLLAITAYRIEGAPNKALWLQPFYTEAKGWYLPNLEGTPPVIRDIPFNKTENYAVRILSTLQGLKIVNTVPNADTAVTQGWVLCRAL